MPLTHMEGPLQAVIAVFIRFAQPGEKLSGRLIVKDQRLQIHLGKSFTSNCSLIVGVEALHILRNAHHKGLGGRAHRAGICINLVPLGPAATRI